MTDNYNTNWQESEWFLEWQILSYNNKDYPDAERIINELKALKDKKYGQEESTKN